VTDAREELVNTTARIIRLYRKIRNPRGTNDPALQQYMEELNDLVDNLARSSGMSLDESAELKEKIRRVITHNLSPSVLGGHLNQFFNRAYEMIFGRRRDDNNKQQTSTQQNDQASQTSSQPTTDSGEVRRAEQQRDNVQSVTDTDTDDSRTRQEEVINTTETIHPHQQQQAEQQASVQTDEKSTQQTQQSKQTEQRTVQQSNDVTEQNLML